MGNNPTLRLLEAIRAAAPGVADVSVGRRNRPETVRVHPVEYQAQAQAAIDAFDWSDAAQRAWEEDRQPLRKALREAAQQALTGNAAYLLIGTPTAAQVRVQAEALTRQVQHIIRRLIEVD